jgi:adhesin transport system outer membrane protein
VIAINNSKINVHEKYLRLAEEKKELTNDTLDFYQVRAKIQVLEDKTLEEEVNKQKTLSKYKKLTGNNLSGEICRPRINEKLLPLSLEEAITQVLAKNNQLRAQKEMVRKQTSKLLISESNFMPTVKLIIEASHDKDLLSPESGTDIIYSAKVQSNWNLYNGGKDVASSQIEKINILQERKILDSLKDDVIDKIKSSYNAYWKLKKRIKNLQNLNISNKVIVKLYSQQLDSGDKTFLDLLDAEKELFRTTLLLKTTEFKLYNEYYSILHSLDMLSDSILMEKNQVCNKYVLNDSIFKSSY